MKLQEIMKIKMNDIYTSRNITQLAGLNFQLDYDIVLIYWYWYGHMDLLSLR